MKKIFNCIVKVFDVSWDYYFITFVVILGLSLCVEENKGTFFGYWMGFVVGLLFVLWLAITLIKAFKNKFKNGITWLLTFALLMLIISFIMSYSNDLDKSKIFSIIGFCAMECYLLCFIILNVYKSNTKLSKIILASLIFLVLGFWLIYDTTYFLGDDGKLFNSLITLYSAIIGGGLTLGGVAWTIKNTQKEKNEEEIKKAKPLLFIRNPRNVSEETLSVKMFSEKCFGSLKKAKGKGYCINYLYIHNADYSHVSIRGFRINDDYHIYDVGQVLTKNTTFRLYSEFVFSYKDEIKYVALIIEDMLENLYEYQVNIKFDTKSVYGTKISITSGIEIKPTTLPISAKDI